MNTIKQAFPIYDKFPELIYLDNAATTQKPTVVIDRIRDFMAFENANIHRGVYELSNHATNHYEEVRHIVANYLNAPSAQCIAFTSGTTDSVNTIAYGYLADKITSADNILVSMSEHHGNFIPWQQLAKSKKAELRIIPIDTTGDLDLVAFERLLDSHTKLVSLQHISNTLGTIHDIEKIIALSHAKSIPVMIDAAQSAALYELDWEKLNYDFLAFSGHKVFGPTGVGILFAAPAYQDDISPYKFGGGIIRDVQLEKSTFTSFPQVLDAGTPNIAGVIGLGAAINYLQQLDRVKIRVEQEQLIAYASEKLRGISQVSVLGQPVRRSGIISFTIDGIHPHEVASFLNQDHIAVRAGMHCTQPLLDFLGVPATVRISTSIYNTKKDIDRLIESLHALISFWS